MNTKLEAITAYMENLIQRKAEELEAIQKKQEEARHQLEEAIHAQTAATERTDLSAYEEATEAKRKAQAALDMYSARLDQVRKRGYVSEEESDQVIDELLSYRKQIDEDLKRDLAAPLQRAREIHAAYIAEVDGIRRTLDAWQRQIHLNYRSRGRTIKLDPLTGEPTDRMEKPITVTVAQAMELAEIIGSE